MPPTAPARVPVRPGLLLACQAETEHARAQFWRLAYKMGLAAAFDRWLEPDSHMGALLEHERAAGWVLNVLSHLQTEEWLIGESLAQGLLRADRAYMRALFARRLKLKLAFRQAAASYRAARKAHDRLERAA